METVQNTSSKQSGRSPARLRRKRLSASLVAVAVVAGIALALAGCGSGSSNNGVANTGSTSTTSTAASADPTSAPSAASQVRLERFSQCMRSHGVTNFPDPSNGRLQLRAGPGTGLDPNSQQFRSAMQACRSLAPQMNASPAQRAQMQAQALRFSQCMRSHGVPNFPDPNFSGGGMKVNLNGIDPNSPQFKSAQQACRSLAPGGVRQGG